jgi:hypothetical protein
LNRDIQGKARGCSGRLRQCWGHRRNLWMVDVIEDRKLCFAKSSNGALCDAV